MSRKTVTVRYYSTIEQKSVDWLWFPYIPYGRITIVQGDPGEGKTTFALNLAARLSIGQAMPESLISQVEPAKVIYQSTEDGLADTVKPRLVSAGADCSRIAFIEDGDYPLTLGDERLEKAVVESGAKLLVLDPLQAFIGMSADMHRANDMRPLFQKLAGIAERTGCAVVIIGHMNKASGSKGLYRGLGSIDIAAAARSVLLIGRLKENPTIRVMTQLKNSLAPEGRSVAFELAEEGRLRWIGYYDVTADDLLNGSPPVEEGKREQAQNLLREMLETTSMSCVEVYSKLRLQGISERTVDTAKRLLNIKSLKQSDGWYWTLPQNNIHEQETSHEEG
jgi:RecA/RadA recombinase